MSKYWCPLSDVIGKRPVKSLDTWPGCACIQMNTEFDRSLSGGGVGKASSKSSCSASSVSSSTSCCLTVFVVRRFFAHCIEMAFYCCFRIRRIFVQGFHC